MRDPKLAWECMEGMVKVQDGWRGDGNLKGKLQLIGE
jgi:hypothetical protein